MKKVVLLTGNSLRHKFFRVYLSLNKNFKIIKTICQNDTKKIDEKKFKSINSILSSHFLQRQKTEIDFFQTFIDMVQDNSKPYFVENEEINSDETLKLLQRLKPDIIICYGTSIIKPTLIKSFKNRFLNIHLGLSPYYRGSGTNVWPMIHKKLEFIGITFMYIDEGVDTGEIIHQTQADIFEGDNPHTIGNRLIIKMTKITEKIIINFEKLKKLKQNTSCGEIFKRKDFDESSCKKLYENFEKGMVRNFLKNKTKKIKLIKNKILEN